MKKILSCMLLLLLSFTLILSVYGQFENLPIVDDAGYLVSDELEQLSEEPDGIREMYNFEVANSGTSYGENNENSHSTKYVMGVIAGCFIVPLLIAFAMMKIKLMKMKTAVGNNYAANYMKQGSMKLDVSRDIFLYSRVTKIPRPKSNSGIHRSSFGGTHGGR